MPYKNSDLEQNRNRQTSTGTVRGGTGSKKAEHRPVPTIEEGSATTHYERGGSSPKKTEKGPTPSQGGRGWSDEPPASGSPRRINDKVRKLN